MTYRLVFATALVLMSTQGLAPIGAENQALPVKDGRPIVATVGDDAIALDELVLQIDQPAETAHLLDGRGKATDLDLLDRLITVRLIAREASTMGLGDIPEIRKQVDVTSRQILRDVLMERVIKDVKPDEAAVEALAKELTREWKTASLLFANEEAARSASEEIAKGASYDEVAAKAVADTRAKADRDEAYHRPKDYLPQIAEAIAKLGVGQVSPVLRLDAGFVVVKVVDIGYPDNAAARAEARTTVLKRQQEVAIKDHEEAVRAKYVLVDQTVLNSIDYAAETPGIDGLLKDTRVVATIEGASPVTVGDLTDYLRMQFFHGGDDPVAQGKRLNTRKGVGLDATVGRRVLNMEALRLGIDKSYPYLDRINAFEESLVFDAFVQKVIVPDNKMREEEVKTYYDGHLAAYSYPGMMRIRSLAFTARGAAEAATEKLRAGTDYAWLADNAEGQAEKGAQGLLAFDGRPVTTDSMPEGVQKAVAATKEGDVRLYASPEGHFYALAVQEIVPPSARPYDEVREEIAKKLYGDKLKKSIDDYAGKLRALTKVEIYLKKAE